MRELGIWHSLICTQQTDTFLPITRFNDGGSAVPIDLPRAQPHVAPIELAGARSGEVSRSWLAGSRSRKRKEAASIKEQGRR